MVALPPETAPEVVTLVNDIVDAMPDVQLTLEKCDDWETLNEAAKHLLVLAIMGKISAFVSCVVDDLITIRLREIKCGKINIHG